VCPYLTQLLHPTPTYSLPEIDANSGAMATLSPEYWHLERIDSNHVCHKHGTLLYTSYNQCAAPALITDLALAAGCLGRDITNVCGSVCVGQQPEQCALLSNGHLQASPHSG
jgi:hypothetical protein